MDEWTFHCHILGVATNATEDRIKKAYKDLAKLLHPDKHGGSPLAKEKFQQLQNSYEFLTSNLRYRSGQNRANANSGPKQKENRTNSREKAQNESRTAQGEPSKPKVERFIKMKRALAGVAVFIAFRIGTHLFAAPQTIVQETVVPDESVQQKPISETVTFFYASQGVNGNGGDSCREVSLQKSGAKEYFHEFAKAEYSNCGDVWTAARSAKGEIEIAANSLESCKCQIKHIRLFQPIAPRKWRSAKILSRRHAVATATLQSDPSLDLVPAEDIPLESSSGPVENPFTGIVETK